MILIFRSFVRVAEKTHFRQFVIHVRIQNRIVLIILKFQIYESIYVEEYMFNILFIYDEYIF